MGTSVRFLHTSDWQLGMPAAFLAKHDMEVPAEFARARLEAVERLGQVAQEKDCAFIVVAGDVFDTNSPEPRQLARAIDTLQALPVPVYLLPGNHDSFDPSSVYRRAEFASLDGVHVLIDSEPVEVAEDVELVGAPFLTRHPATDPVAEALQDLPPLPDAHLRILLAHGQVESFGDDALLDLDGITSAIAEGTLHYAALGDRHGTLQVTPEVWFSGSPEVTDFDDTEKDSGNVLIVDISPEGTFVEPVSVGKWAFRAVNGSVSSDTELDAWLARIEAIEHKDRTVVKYSLEGEVTIDQQIRLDAAIEGFRDRFTCFYPRTRTHDLVVVPGEDERADMGLTGFPARAAAELHDLATGQGPDAHTAQRAWRMLYRYTREDV